ncbi:MAG: SDR family NAD(P)-dependent oxidoreductase [Pseudomonadota bacterium]|nr:SDR family oxidoreductase [Nisaea sp.]MEC7972572.1 SDR family NAD(P)-dependent oxidoreductase [Pseudomonadota bacterium]MEC9044238.1 SDR family NAD(P)-dependent oxidoreductase [Pseudomonadota bacterium]MEC9099788.1 SDR family NAD(P)-dependent oxidoreductase [Pseudomonadota bacterium]|tara:strand:- start:600 stop:1349 length:750 start_codon:yes stop_codon:yes gene_type:complete
MSVTYDYKDRSAVITGGAKGIGLATAKRFHASGAKVSLWDMDESRLNEVKDTFPDNIDIQVVDVTNWDSVNAAAENSLKSIGGADILVNSAGIAGPNFKTWEYPVEEWLKVVDIDLNGTFLCCRALVPFMRENKYGRIVNIASIAGKEGNPNAAPYSAAKAGVIGLTKSLGKELADMNITVNCITPAAVRTEIFDQISQEHIDFMLSKIPIGRFGTVDEIANLITWLSSEECSFSTGGVFDISGGRATY